MDDHEWKAAALNSVAHLCEANLEYEAHLAAPGKGQSWRCKVCGEGFHRANADAPANRWEDLSIHDFELQPWEVI
jgi:hypothetical protein